MKPDNNIPAYPTQKTEMGEYGLNETCYVGGMTLLDHFAGLAMQVMMKEIDCKNSPDNAAHHAYRYAAAMLEARKQFIS